jgi:hypothetical protein
MRDFLTNFNKNVGWQVLLRAAKIDIDKWVFKRGYSI